MFRLCVTLASTLGLFNRSGVDFSFSQVSDESLHWNIDSIEPYTDEYGDFIIPLNISFFPEFGYPVLKFRLQHPTGETGFDSIKTPKQIQDLFLSNSFLLSDQPEPLLSFSEFKEKVSGDYMSFFYQKGKIPFDITYHKPDASLAVFLKANRFSMKDALMNLKILIESIHLCDAVTVWSFAYGTNPVVLSARSKNFIAAMKSKLNPDIIYLQEVTSENNLPEW